MHTSTGSLVLVLSVHCRQERPHPQLTHSLSLTLSLSPPFAPALSAAVAVSAIDCVERFKKAAMESVEPAVVEAQEETTKAIGAEQDDDEGGPAARPPPKPVLSGDDRYRLESAAKKARKAGGCVPQVRKG